MARVFADRPELLVKLSATSLMLSAALAKLYTYQMNIITELRRDADYSEELGRTYLLSADDDEKFSEMFAGVSAEADKIMAE